MKSILSAILSTAFVLSLHAQDSSFDNKHRSDIVALIDQYALARERSDTALLRSILTTEIDQLVSTGEWREGIKGSMQGMLQSSGSNPGERTLIVDKVRFINPGSAIVDARYEIKNTDGSVRKMWSTFIVIHTGEKWKITAIRNMLPATGR